MAFVIATAADRSSMKVSMCAFTRAYILELNLDDEFERKNEIVEVVEEELEKVMSAYGYKIAQTRIVEIELYEHDKRSMN
ncbi:hypersensitive-induced response protein-like protein 1 [Rutidosis leptorrhynchoides]|uniref:hypersensitive-induced response protein-like protein 1 n=1 Tax=Rutidosis leptorrhynchoides TaxID=125765 RepID=UPI003A99D5B6